jgi:hypothetical protein
MAVDDMWEHDRFAGGGGRGGGGVNLVGRALGGEGGAKLLISNLHHAVTQQDIKARAAAATRAA